MKAPAQRRKHRLIVASGFISTFLPAHVAHVNGPVTGDIGIDLSQVQNCLEVRVCARTRNGTLRYIISKANRPAW